MASTDHSKHMGVVVIGLGTMGREHVQSVVDSPNLALAGVCDISREVATELGSRYSVPAGTDLGALLNEVECDGVIVVTPHPDHGRSVAVAFEHGKHVLVEKPIAPAVSEADEMLEAHRRAERRVGHLVFATMLQLRTYPQWKRVKHLVASGSLGRIIRTSLIITDWFRTQAYYDSGGWRATWATEGGGVLMNQAPHNLDLYQWLLGQPQWLTAVAGFGRYHRIEVEDEISIIAEHENGMIGNLHFSTAESPGTNRLEIVGEQGSLVVDRNHLTRTINETSCLEVLKSSPERFTQVRSRTEEETFDEDVSTNHRVIIEDFAAAWKNGTEPIAPAAQAVNSLEIANAAILAAVSRQRVELPLDRDRYESLLGQLKTSGIGR